MSCCQQIQEGSAVWVSFPWENLLKDKIKQKLGGKSRLFFSNATNITAARRFLTSICAFCFLFIQSEADPGALISPANRGGTVISTGSSDGKLFFLQFYIQLSRHWSFLSPLRQSDPLNSWSLCPHHFSQHFSSALTPSSFKPQV